MRGEVQLIFVVGFPDTLAISAGLFFSFGVALVIKLLASAKTDLYLDLRILEIQR